MSGGSIGERLREIEKERKSKERFIIARMWFSTAMSLVFPDRQVIPKNIGNDVFIGNNQAVTKNSISQMLIIREMGESTPLALFSKITKHVKSQVPGVRVDFVVKNEKYRPDLDGGGLNSRVGQWTRMLDNPRVRLEAKKRAARLLYTVDIAQSKVKLFRSRMYVILRSPDGHTAQQAMKSLTNMLDENKKARYTIVKSKLQEHLEYTSLLSNRPVNSIRDVPYNITSATILTEILPAIQGLNSEDGSFMGIDKLNRDAYYENFRATAKGKNIYVAGLSGTGKTFLVLTWLLDAYATKYNICIMDLKGNEFAAFTEACNGVTLSLGPDATQFVNTYILKKDQAEDYVLYYNNRLALSKEQMLVLADLSDKKKGRGEELIEAFLQSMYGNLGVTIDNPNSWERTRDLNPYIVYDRFETFMSESMMQEYSDIAQTMLNRLRIYMSRKGSKSHMFREEFVLEDVLKTQVLTFDFGLLNSSGMVDEAMFKLKVMFMELLNDEFVRYKKSIGEWTMKVLEESQIAEEYLRKVYKKEFTVRRAQNQVTILLGNSTSSLAQDKDFASVLENINILCLGVLYKSSRDFLTKEYGLEKYVSKMENIANDPDYENMFLFINRMRKDATSTILQAYVPDHVRDSKIFKVVDTDVS